MTAEQKLLDAGYEDIIIFKDYGYDEALVGVSQDGRAIYDYDLMVDCLAKEMGLEDALEWIDYNTLRALPYIGDGAPIIMYKL